MSYGHTPAYLEVNHQDYLKLIKGDLPFYRQKWKRVPGEVDFCKGEEGLEAIFHFNVKSSIKPDHHIFFSYTYPYTYNDMIYSMNEINAKAVTHEMIHFEK